MGMALCVTDVDLSHCVCVYVWERGWESGRVSIYLCQLRTDANAAWIRLLWIIDKCSSSNELAFYYKQRDWSVAVNHWSSISQSQYLAFSSVCIYAYFIKSHVLLMHVLLVWAGVVVFCCFWWIVGETIRERESIKPLSLNLNVIYWCLTHFPDFTPF